MQLNPYLHFNGACEAAFRYYAQCLGGRITAMLPYSSTPAAEHVPADWADKITHARLELGDCVLLGSDCPPAYFTETKGFYVYLEFDDATEAERVFQALSVNGAVTMAFAQTFWAHRFGMLTDQFGIPWMINCERAAG
jgi:PhnB protein